MLRARQACGVSLLASFKVTTQAGDLLKVAHDGMNIMLMVVAATVYCVSHEATVTGDQMQLALRLCRT